MKTGKIEIIAGGVFLATLAGATLAGLKYRNKHSAYHRKYDPDHVQEFKGKIEEIMHSGNENGEDKGVELILKTGDKLLPVHVGPEWFIEHQQEGFKIGDNILVKGSIIEDNHEDLIVAEWLKRGDYLLRLRFENGHPLWNAWMKE
ncbi:hypothetical protein [Rhodohalobacter sp.]|uniref:hypothetical protein n=1 Tax=Rhodohalobacter sp. TaxID=1974210 RepID=UPI003563C6B4